MKKIVTLILALLISVTAIPVFTASAETTDAFSIVDENLSTGKYGQVTSAKTTVTINENAAGDLNIPLDFLNSFDQNVCMPGDTYTYYFEIVNNSKYDYSYADSSFAVTVGGDMNEAKWNTFYSKLFSVSMTRTLNMASSADTDCGIANYLDKTSGKYAEANSALTGSMNAAAGSKSSEQVLYIGLNGPLMGNEYMSCSFGGSMSLTLKQNSSSSGSDTAVAVSVITPKKMSIRLQDGTVLKNGDGFNVEIGEEVKFQMCSNNWDNDTYDDNGNGLCGTVVYTVKVSNDYNGRNYDAATHTFTLPKGDLVLRTDVNKCFMAYRYHFTKGDYNKQTGIVNVINTPLESLSVNLPLGSTVTSDAYKGYGKIDSANVFIQNSDDLELSYTDYYWEY